MIAQRIKICPACGQEIRVDRFVSRKDNKTPICGRCSVVEALHERARFAHRRNGNH